MKIIKPTNPPSMAVIVDPIITEPVVLAIPPADWCKDRIDIVYAKPGMVGVCYGALAYEPSLPALPKGMRALAHIYVPHAINVILPHLIEELS